ncbi:heptaprenyl diphosphate synthase component 1 [Oceanobacillus kapialis]|uniref:Heptaprenyl diphosphate synthase component 1 n=1 Tax=Oceanobacillus kapialis TaxID=481353 RepID=A0ABW5Q5G7_9BACI
MTARLDNFHLEKLIREKMKHAYLYTHIEEPLIDQAKLILLTTILEETSLSKAQKENVIITAMLIQIALDTHDKVPSTNEMNEDKANKVSGQLNVLAGDYYSGLYYLLLSEMKEISLIHTLASAIKEINENKMTLYYNEAVSFKAHLGILTTVESLLSTSVANYVGLDHYNQVSREWIITNKLLHERQNYLQHGKSFIIESGTHYTGDIGVALSIVDSIIERGLHELSLFLENNPKRETILGLAIKKLLQENSKLVEEG